MLRSNTFFLLTAQPKKNDRKLIRTGYNHEWSTETPKRGCNWTRDVCMVGYFIKF